jgi:alkylhydroperoxidase family enzyme
MPSLVSAKPLPAFRLPMKLVGLINAHPRIGEKFWPLYKEVMRAPNRFSPQARGTIAAISATAQGCAYLARSPADSTLIEDNNRMLYQLAEKLSDTPTRVTSDDWQPLIDAGVDQLGLIEFAYVVGLSNYMTRLADGLGISTDQPALAIQPADNSPVVFYDMSKGLGAERENDQPAGDMYSLGWFLDIRAAGAPKDSPYNFGYRSEMGTLLSAHPRIGPAFWALFSEIMFAPGALTRAEREMVAAVAAAAQDCHY